MKKKDEISLPSSCLNKADDNELVFVLLGRDIVAPVTIRYWCFRRVGSGKNKWHDSQIQEALAWAESCDGEHVNEFDDLEAMFL